MWYQLFGVSTILRYKVNDIHSINLIINNIMIGYFLPIVICGIKSLD